MKVGIIGAMDIEVAKLQQQMESSIEKRISGVTYVCGKIHGMEVVVAQAGVGKVNAAVCCQTMILVFRPEVIINVGIAGAIDPELKPCDIVIAEKVVQHDMDTTQFGDPPGFITGIGCVEIPCSAWVIKQLAKAAPSCKYGVVATGDQFISERSQRAGIGSKFEAIAVEMEGGSIGQVCRMNQVDFGVLRSISDGAEDEALLSYPEFRLLAAEQSSQIVLHFLKQLKEIKDEKN